MTVAKNRSPQGLPLDFVDLAGKGNLPVPSLINTRIAIEKLGLVCRYDVFRDRYAINGSEFGNDVLQLSDMASRKLRELIRMTFDFDPGAQNSIDALYRACEAHRYHSVRDYVDALRWDGKPRLGSWLVDYMRADDTPFVRAVGRLALVASVRRIRQPGCKFDYMVVLQSPEGFGKSSALAELYGADNFTDQAILGASDKEVAEALRGRWGAECPELVGLRRSDIEKVKAMTTRQSDRGRPAYGRAVVEVPRSCVFWGTTNDEQYLRALSGMNRRFLPVTVGEIDVAGIRRDRDQLWAEAADDEEFTASLALPAKLWADAAAERESRTQLDPWAEGLEDVARRAIRAAGMSSNRGRAIYDGANGFDTDGRLEERVASEFVLGDVLSIPLDRRTPEHAKRLGAVMRSLGWTGPKKARIGREPVRAYVRPSPLGDLL